MTPRDYETLSLNAFLMASGHRFVGWCHPQMQADAGLDIERCRQLARTAQRGCFDATFLSDTLAMLPGDPQVLSRMARTEHFESLTLLAALAASMCHIGPIATLTTSYNDAANVADGFSTLQAISGNRCGWGLVISSNAREASNFGREQHFAHAGRCGLAERFREQLQALILPEVGLSLLSDLAGGTDLCGYPLEGPLPELQRRGLFHTRHSGHSLRKHLGLAVSTSPIQEQDHG